MLVECQHCGAPLDIKSDRFVRCSYCDHVNRVRTMKTISPSTPVGWQTPPAWTPPPQYPVRAQQALQYHRVRQPVANRGGCIVLFIVLLTVPAILIPIIASSGLGASTPFFGLDTDANGSLANIDLNATPTPTITGTTSTGVDASGILNGRGNCRGHVPRQPHAVVRTTRPASIVVLATASFDSTLVLRAADGTFYCDDDSGGGSNPMIRADLPAGAHRVWVGQYNETTGGSFSLDIEGGGGTLTPFTQPSLGTLNDASGPIQGSYPGDTHGFVDATTLGSPCRGFVSSGPQLTVQVSAVRSVRFVTRDNDGDLVMLVREANGAVHCDDDSGGGGNPQIDLELAPGVTGVWVGNYSSGERHHFVLDVGAPGGSSGQVLPSLDLAAAPALGTLALDGVREMAQYTGVTDPQIDVNGLDSRCRGFIGLRPDIVMQSSTPRDLELRTVSNQDLVLVVRQPDGTLVCDDDSGGGGDARLRRRWDRGTHHVWVGSFSRGQRQPFRLRIGAGRR